jgi:alditol oxidase
MRGNWAGNVVFGAGVVHQPGSVDEVCAIVAAASATGRSVHATGSRHSFSTVADVAPGGDLVSTVGLDRVLVVDHDAMTVTVEAGIRYGELAATLHAEGLALHNLPSLPHITVAGAVATATHGSGDRNGNLATAVRSLDLALADGTVLTVGPDDPRLPGAVVNLGALGVVVRLTLAVEPTFDVAQTLYRELPFDAGVEALDAVMGSAYSVSLFTDYQRDVFDQVWWKGRVGRDGEAPADVLGAAPAGEPLHPVAGVPADSCTEQLGVPGAWADRLPHFRLGFEPSSGDELQSEYFVARSDGAAALRAVRTLRAELAPVIKVSEIRTVAADDLWLSTAYGRDTVALHFTWVNDEPRVLAFLPTLEAALAPFGARPHWGKLTAMPPSTILERTPMWSEFAGLRRALDPSGTFLNPYVSRLR